MASKIGVKDLKNRASEIIHEVHEQEAEYIVTLRGEPVAMLLPLSEEGARELRRSEPEETLAKMESLAEEIARAWRSPKKAADLLDEQRR